MQYLLLALLVVYTIVYMVLDKFLSKTKAPDADYLVGLDIGTEYVKVAIARVKGDEIEVVGAGRAHQELGDMHAGAILILPA